jgi:hypothetical protein
MLKITLLEGPGQVTLKLEGRIAGTWVTELEDSWRSALSTMAGRPLRLQLADVEHVDPAGTYLLALLRLNGVQLLASGTVMTEVVRTIERDWPLDEERSAPR